MEKKNGREYNFVTKEQFLSDIEKDAFLEYRTYNTLVKGVPDTWYYGCPKKTLDELDPNKDYVIILDMEGTKDFLNYYGKDKCFVCFVEVSDDIRKERAMSRGSFDETEWNRRAADDNIKFSREVIRELANARVLNNVGSTNDLKESFMRALNDYKNDKYSKDLTEDISDNYSEIKFPNTMSKEFRTVSNIMWSPDEEILMEQLENVREEKAAKAMEIPLDRYKNMTYSERLDYLYDMLRHNRASDYMLTEVLDMPDTVVLPKEVVKEAIEDHDVEVISDYLSGEYGFFHEGFTLSEELEAEIGGKERE